MMSLQMLLNNHGDVRGDGAENVNLLPDWSLREYGGWCIIFRHTMLLTTRNVHNKV